VRGVRPPDAFLDLPLSGPSAVDAARGSVCKLLWLPRDVRVFVCAFLWQCDRFSLGRTCLDFFDASRQGLAVAHLGCNRLEDVRREMRLRGGEMYLRLRNVRTLHVHSVFHLGRDLALFDAAKLRDVCVPALSLQQAADVARFASMRNLTSLALTGWNPLRLSASMEGWVQSLTCPRIRNLHVSAVDELNAGAVGCLLRRILQLSPAGTVTFTADRLVHAQAVEHLPRRLHSVRVEHATADVLVPLAGNVVHVCDVVSVARGPTWPAVVRRLLDTGAAHVMAPRMCSLSDTTEHVLAGSSGIGRFPQGAADARRKTLFVRCNGDGQPVAPRRMVHVVVALLREFAEVAVEFGAGTTHDWSWPTPAFIDDGVRDGVLMEQQTKTRVEFRTSWVTCLHRREVQFKTVHAVRV